MARKPYYLAVLPKRQQIFVETYVQSGSVAAAEMAAQYAKGSGSAILQLARVADAVRQYTSHLLQNYGPIALNTLKSLAEGQVVEGKQIIPAPVMLAAARDLLDRVTGKAAEQLNVKLDLGGAAREEELLARIATLQRELGLQVDETIDVSGVEVDDEAEFDETPKLLTHQSTPSE